MKNFLLPMILLLCLISEGFAQGVAPVAGLASPFFRGEYEGFNSPLVGLKPTEKDKTKGSGYLHADWRRAVMVVNGVKKPVMHHKVKLDVLNGLVELDMGAAGQKVLNFSKIDTLYLEAPSGDVQTFLRKYQIMAPYQVEQIRELIIEAPFQLVKEYQVTIKPSNYNRALSAGNNYNELRIESKLYVSEEGQFSEMYKKKKEIISFLSKYFPNTRQMYDEHKPRLKDEDELLAFIQLCREQVE